MTWSELNKAQESRDETGASSPVAAEK